jgi:hypothetical protein
VRFKHAQPFVRKLCLSARFSFPLLH